MNLFRVETAVQDKGKKQTSLYACFDAKKQINAYRYHHNRNTINISAIDLTRNLQYVVPKAENYFATQRLIVEWMSFVNIESTDGKSTESLYN